VRDNGTGIEMLLVPPGTFEMGCIMGSNQHGCNFWEQPVHQVTLTSAFYLGRYEVTQSQWMATIGSNPSRFVPANGYPGSGSRPVERVSWDTIQGYLSATGFRLPTEAEWEYACRAGTQTPFYNGSQNDSTLGSLAWYSASGGDQTRPVGGKLSNAFGFHDMLGNVWEFVSDGYGEYSPVHQTDPTGPREQTVRVLRGGCWDCLPDGLRSSDRAGGAVNWISDTVGFRVARNP
jgi:formylglycine-generating enzyme required for sulfatase activity